jgi:D-alanyl-D-alanine dipeptidase
LVIVGTLEALPITDAVTIAPSLPANRRYALPITNAFLLTLGKAYHERFGTALVVDSAVRPRDTQERLRHTNYAAAPADGELASSHESGLTVDISKRMSGAQLRWVRSMLSMYEAMNVVIAEEERGCFHVEVIGEPE